MTTTGRDVLEALHTILRASLETQATKTATVFVGPPRNRSSRQPRKGENMATVQLMQQQEFDVTIANIKDARGRDSTFDGVPTWAVSDDTIVDLRVGETGMNAIVGSLGIDGAATVTVTGDARMGPDVVPVIAVISVVVAPGEAVVFEVVPGAVRDRA